MAVFVADSPQGAGRTSEFHHRYQLDTTSATPDALVQLQLDIN